MPLCGHVSRPYCRANRVRSAPDTPDDAVPQMTPHEVNLTDICSVMKKVAAGLLLLASLTLASCAPKYSAATQKPVADMSCTEIKDELVKLAKVREEANSKSGVSKENVLFVLFFWPGAVVNEMDNRDVIAKVEARTAELTKAQSAKGCPAN